MRNVIALMLTLLASITNADEAEVITIGPEILAPNWNQITSTIGDQVSAVVVGTSSFNTPCGRYTGFPGTLALVCMPPKKEKGDPNDEYSVEIDTGCRWDFDYFKMFHVMLQVDENPGQIFTLRNENDADRDDLELSGNIIVFEGKAAIEVVRTLQRGKTLRVFHETADGIGKPPRIAETIFNVRDIREAFEHLKEACRK